MSTTHLQREIEGLKQKVLIMSAKVEKSIEDTSQALINLNLESAKKVIEIEDSIDQHEVDIEEECLKIMALYQPVASDLRMVVGLLKMNNDLERMADLSANIARYVIKISKLEVIEISPKFNLIFSETRKMVRGCLDALVNSDQVLAAEVCINDDIVDGLNIEIIHEIQEQITQNIDKIRPLLLLISVTRSIERIGDYATNIAEDVIYMMAGEIVRHKKEAP